MGPRRWLSCVAFLGAGESGLLHVSVIFIEGVGEDAIAVEVSADEAGSVPRTDAPDVVQDENLSVGADPRSDADGRHFHLGCDARGELRRYALKHDREA